MDSSIIGAFVGSTRATRENGGDVKLAKVNPDVGALFELTCLDQSSAYTLRRTRRSENTAPPCKEELLASRCKLRDPLGQRPPAKVLDGVPLDGLAALPPLVFR